MSLLDRFRLGEKVSIVTGGGWGLGPASAKTMAEVWVKTFTLDGAGTIRPALVTAP